MKKLLALLLILSLNQLITAQSNFTAENNTISWQKIFSQKTNNTKANLYLKTKGFKTDKTDDVISFTKNFTLSDLKNHGYKTMSYPMYINSGSIEGIIEFKENRYRVTITSITMYDDDNGNGEDISTYTVNKKGIKTSKSVSKTLNMLNSYFNTLFLIKKTSDW